jgi:uroporphyrinogen decarboxylase
MDAPFLLACRGLPAARKPIWLMRQAGRYMEIYRDLRKKHTMLELIHAPELAAEVTMQPMEAFDLDAAIIFSDILPPLQAMGLPLDFRVGEGPRIDRPIRSHADIEALAEPDAEEIVPATVEAIRLVRQVLPRDRALIGFAGAPFTLASYAIEGQSTRRFLKVKGLLQENPKQWHELMGKFSRVVSGYLIAQIRAGADAVQLFDSWVGELSPGDFRDHVLPHIQRIIRSVKEAAPHTPVIYFGTNTSGLLGILPETGADVIGVDWRIELDEAWRRVGEHVTLQGNLDPHTLLAGPQAWQTATRRILDLTQDRPNHIFNLGHGIMKETDPGAVRDLVDFVHEHGTHVETPNGTA